MRIKYFADTFLIFIRVYPLFAFDTQLNSQNKNAIVILNAKLNRHIMRK